MNEVVTVPATDHVYVNESPIHGKGLFAKTPIKADQLIGRYEGPVVHNDEDDGTYVLWVLDEDGTGYGVDGQNEMRYINHDRNPNAVFYETEVYALRDIAPDEEITVHYGDDWDELPEEEYEEDDEAEAEEGDATAEHVWLQNEPEQASAS